MGEQTMSLQTVVENVISSGSTTPKAIRKNAKKVVLELAKYCMTGDYNSLTSEEIRGFIRTNNTDKSEIDVLIYAQYAEHIAGNQQYKEFKAELEGLQALIDEIIPDLALALAADGLPLDEAQAQAETSIAHGFVQYYLTGNVHTIPRYTAYHTHCDTLVNSLGRGKCLVETLFTRGFMERLGQSSAELFQRLQDFLKRKNQFHDAVHTYANQNQLERRERKMRDRLPRYFTRQLALEKLKDELREIEGDKELVISDEDRPFIEMMYPRECMNALSTLPVGTPRPDLSKHDEFDPFAPLRQEAATTPVTGGEDKGIGLRRDIFKKNRPISTVILTAGPPSQWGVDDEDEPSEDDGVEVDEVTEVDEGVVEVDDSNKHTTRAKTLPAVSTYYSHYCTKQAGRWHLFAVKLTDQSELEQRLFKDKPNAAKDCTGDQLKSRLLDLLRMEIDALETLDDLHAYKSKLADRAEYKILCESQGLWSYIFHKDTSSKKAVDRMIVVKAHYLSQIAETEPESSQAQM
jgi:hypothetical protein